MTTLKGASSKPFARTEDRRADAHHRRAFFNRHLEAVPHDPRNTPPASPAHTRAARTQARPPDAHRRRPFFTRPREVVAHAQRKLAPASRAERAAPAELVA